MPINYFFNHDEPAKSCLLALREIILSQGEGITETWQYGMPFYYHHKKRICYLWFHKKTKQPYIGIVDGNLIEYPGLVIEKRSRMKVFYVDPSKDLPVSDINAILQMAIKLHQ